MAELASGEDLMEQVGRSQRDVMTGVYVNFEAHACVSIHTHTHTHRIIFRAQFLSIKYIELRNKGSAVMLPEFKFGLCNLG